MIKAKQEAIDWLLQEKARKEKIRKRQAKKKFILSIIFLAIIIISVVIFNLGQNKTNTNQNNIISPIQNQITPQPELKTPSYEVKTDKYSLIITNNQNKELRLEIEYRRYSNWFGVDENKTIEVLIPPNQEKTIPDEGFSNNMGCSSAPCSISLISYREI